eukprot:13787091-Alexandrium_andersonii.AAC.1
MSALALRMVSHQRPLWTQSVHLYCDGSFTPGSPSIGAWAVVVVVQSASGFACIGSFFQACDER